MKPLAIALGLVLSGAAPAQDDDVAGGDELGRALAALGEPIDLERLRVLIEGGAATGSAAARRVIAHLSCRRGYASAWGLLALAVHQDARVREGAMSAFAEIGIRVEDGAQGVRTALHDIDADVRLAAIAALGVNGDAADVPVLLDLASAEDPRVQAGGFRALRALTGLRLPNQQRQWAHWWSQAIPQATRRVEAARRTLEKGGKEADVQDARRLLAQSVWIDPRKASETARRWIDSGEPRLRAEGCLLVANARLGNLVPDLRGLDTEREPAVIAAASECGAALGIRVPCADGASTPPSGR
jgi:hypothetical protein